ncbi:hypothetical protein ACP4OV_005480 [Aristida adscensionis]
MDSGNSAGSLQSSSGGDDFDSSCGAGAVDSSPLSALLLRPQQPPSTAPVPPFFDAFFYALHDLATPATPSSLPALWSSPPFTAAAGASPTLSPSPACHGVAASPDQASAPAGTAPPPRGPRKRTRASRRAPTTVLTTDTSNFRAMVQEFTGVPSPPFAGAPARSRFDNLFQSPYSMRSAGAGATAAASLPAYLLRPFAHKLQASPPFNSPSTSSSPTSSIAIAASTAASATPSTTAVPTGGDSYQLAPAPATSAILGIQDHTASNCVSFQSPLGAQAQLAGDANCKYPAHLMLHTAGAPPAPRLQEPAEFVGLTHAHGIMNSEMPDSRNRDDVHGGGDELSGLVGTASVTRTAVASGCKTPLLGSKAKSTSEGTVGGAAATTTAVASTAAMPTQAMDSWISTSD